MASARKKPSSAKLHKSRTRIQSSRLAHTKETNRKLFFATKRAILTIIILTMLVVVLATLLSSFSSPERVVKQKIEAIASDYYENYFYPQLTAIDEMQNASTLTEKMKRYTSSGFAKVTLRQLLLFDGERYAEAAAILTTYCDENQTFVQIFPESPFGRTNYHIDYHYSCDF